MTSLDAARLLLSSTRLQTNVVYHVMTLLVVGANACGQIEAARSSSTPQLRARSFKLSFSDAGCHSRQPVEDLSNNQWRPYLAALQNMIAAISYLVLALGLGDTWVRNRC